MYGLFRQNVQNHLAASTPRPKENILQQSQRKEDLRMTKVDHVVAIASSERYPTVHGSRSGDDVRKDILLKKYKLHRNISKQYSCY